MIWADRIALIWAIVVWGFIFLTGQIDHAAGIAAFLTILPWFLLRATDFIFSGTIR